MNHFYLTLLLLALVLIECLIGGLRMAFALPSYGILSLAAVSTLLSFRKPQFPANIICLGASLLFFGYLLGRILKSPVEYLARPETYLFLLHNAVLDIDYNRLPGVAFWPGNIGGIVNGPLWSLPCEALLYLMLFGLGVCRLLTLPVTLLLVVVGIAALWFDTAGETFGSALWLLGFFAAGMCLYRLRGLGPRLFAWPWALLALIGLALSIPARLFLVAFPLFGGYLVIWLALNRRLPVVRAARFGDLSYGLYIYGWPIEQCVVYFSGGTAPWWEVFGLSLALAVPTAFLSWHAIESRCRWRARRAERVAATPAGATASG